MKKYNVPSLDRALDVIEFLASVQEACPLSIIAKNIGKSPSDLFRILDCLVRRGYVRKDSVTNNYAVTLRMYSITNGVPFIKRLIDAAVEPMSILTKQVGDSCHISVLEGSDLVVLYEQEGMFPVNIHARPGARIPVSMTSSGRVLLGMLPANQQKVILDNDQNFKNETDDFRKYFREEIEKIGTEKSYIIRPERYASVAIDIIAPVKLFGDTYAALLLSCLELQNNRKQRKDIEDLRRLTEDTAAAIENFLGHTETLP